MFTLNTKNMTTDEQIKTVIAVFNELDHKNQVGLFIEIRAQLIARRKEMAEKYTAELEQSHNDLKSMLEGTDLITKGII